MEDDRGELDLTKQIEEKDKLIQELRMNMRDYIMMHQQDKDLLAVKIKEVEELARDNKLLAKQVEDVLNVRRARNVS
jgi:hypothetical protein